MSRRARGACRFAAAAVCAALLPLAAGCSGRMRDQARIEPFEDVADRGLGHLQPVAGTVPRGALPAAEPRRTLPLLERGRERYGIYCAPCHDAAGTGEGIIVRHGFPQPRSFHHPEVRAASDSAYRHHIAHGYGVMPSYAAQVPPADRHAIVAYIRALQLSRHAPVAALEPADRRRLEGSR